MNIALGAFWAGMCPPMERSNLSSPTQNVHEHPITKKSPRHNNKAQTWKKPFVSTLE